MDPFVMDWIQTHSTERIVCLSDKKINRNSYKVLSTHLKHVPLFLLLFLSYQSINKTIIK